MKTDGSFSQLTQLIDSAFAAFLRLGDTIVIHSPGDHWVIMEQVLPSSHRSYFVRFIYTHVLILYDLKTRVNLFHNNIILSNCVCHLQRLSHKNVKYLNTFIVTVIIQSFNTIIQYGYIFTKSWLENWYHTWDRIQIMELVGGLKICLPFSGRSYMKWNHIVLSMVVRDKTTCHVLYGIHCALWVFYELELFVVDFRIYDSIWCLTCNALVHVHVLNCWLKMLNLTFKIMLHYINYLHYLNMPYFLELLCDPQKKTWNEVTVFNGIELCVHVYAHLHTYIICAGTIIRAGMYMGE